MSWAAFWLWKEGCSVENRQNRQLCVSWEQGLPVCYQGPSWCKWAAEEQLWGWLWCYKFTKCSPLRHSERQMDSVPASRDWSMAAAASLKIKKVVFLYQIKSVSELIVPWWEFCLQCELDWTCWTHSQRMEGRESPASGFSSGFNPWYWAATV